MAPLKHTIVLTGIVLVYILSSFEAAPAVPKHARVSKDTDEDSALKSKLGRIQELIAQLDAEGESNDQKKVDDILPPHPTKVEAEEKQMRSLGREDREKFRKTSSGLKAHKAHRSSGSSGSDQLSSSTEDSIEVLAQALARLHQSQAVDVGTFGEKMGTSYNEPGKPEQPYDQTEAGRQLQQTIAQALARLQEEDQPEPREVERPQSPVYKNFHEEAIRMIENRLLKDLTVADRLGISVDDLIQDFEEQEARQETLQKLEGSLASLIGDRDE